MQRPLLSVRRLLLLAGVAVVLALLLGRLPAWTAEKNATDPAAVERTRDEVHMLDDLYKSYVVHITETYVKAQKTTPAATVTKHVFADMKDKGYYSARLIDASGSPVNAKNVAQSDFEKRAVAELKGGRGYFEEVGSQDGKPVLRAATRVPVVMKACINCHVGTKEGDLLGALVYEVPIK